MDIFTLAFVALLLAGILMGGMLCFSLLVAPLVDKRLPTETAIRFGRRLHRHYHVSGAVLAFAAAALIFWSIPGIVLAVTGAGFLFAFLWLAPSINRNRDRGLEGDTAAAAVAQKLGGTNHALNGTLIVLVLAAFVMIAIGWT